VREIGRHVIPAKGVRSLIWQGDELVDWVGGGARYQLDGTSERAGVFYAYRFDAAAATADGEWIAIYQRLGTKALLLRGGQLVRELDRSYYHADVYEYPIALWRLPDGRAVVAHCPEAYNELHIDETETGRRLTARDGKSSDLFHSRLAVSPDGRWLMSAGWIWHPIDFVGIYDIAAALARPETLDDARQVPAAETSIEISAAAFAGRDRLVVSAGLEDLGNTELRPGHLGAYRLDEERYERATMPDERPGTIMPAGDFVVGFYEHPKLIELETGRIVARWPMLATGTQTSSIIHHIEPPPPLALDPANLRFAVAGPDEITVIELG
jgi:hypothetical protein